MNILIYNEIDQQKIPNFNKITKALEAEDFKAAEVKKISDNLYRARLNKQDRLLFTLHHFNGQYYALILEHVAHHTYEKSRFMRAHKVDFNEDNVAPLTTLDATDSKPLNYINPKHKRFHLLDKILSFDEIQQDIFQLHPPLIIIGSAGSGKTALTLEKMKSAVGSVLYVTRSPYLAQNAQKLYYAHHYENDAQEIDFLSFDDFLSTIKVPAGREMLMREFAQWFTKHRQNSGDLKDPHQLFEEFKGVLTGPAIDQPYLSQHAYLSLGIKQSIFVPEQREKVYDLFQRYLAHMQENGLYDANIVSQQYLSLIEPRYDFVLVDEVQDLTNVQLQLILKSLQNPTEFILCGDSNQIVHPNFFSWAKIKTLFYETTQQQPPVELIRILNTNYRNSSQVTELANRVLKIKNLRFGSVDRESNYLVQCPAETAGQAILLNDKPQMLNDLNAKTRKSTRYAVIVMHPEQKAQARTYFNTPLIFSIQEAKGLEYENIILYNFLSSEGKRFREISQGLKAEDLNFEELVYARAKDKSDKSLEIYKFYINALYVAITRAIKNIYLLETDVKQPIIDLMALRESASLELADQQSSLEEWQQEARKLELQGKQEQADEIRQQILQYKTVPWEVLESEALATLATKALVDQDKKAKLLLFDYTLVYQEQRYLNELAKIDFKPTKNLKNGVKQLNQKYFMPYEAKQPNTVLRQVEQYGVDFRNVFNQTPLMVAARTGNANLVECLIERGADPDLRDNLGRTPLQIALGQAMADDKYQQQKLATIFELLIADSLTIQVDGRLIKLGNHLMEFFLLNLMIGAFYVRINGIILVNLNAFSSAWLEKALANFPSHVLPERRKKRAYISSILSKNEYQGGDKYNRKLFWRIKHGQYLPNPKLSIRIQDQWYRIYDLLKLECITISSTFESSINPRLKAISEANIALLDTNIQSMLED